jgi:hypothetical protein
VLVRLDREPGLERATCLREWWPNDIVHESVILGRSKDGHKLTDEELDAWVATFPIEPMGSTEFEFPADFGPARNKSSDGTSHRDALHR